VSVSRDILDDTLNALSFHALFVLAVFEDNLCPNLENPTALSHSSLCSLASFLNFNCYAIATALACLGA
jgi:hypothetical protein